MRFYKPKRSKEFSGKVEVAITAIDTSGVRMSGRDGMERKTIRLEDTTPDEAYQVIQDALDKHIHSKKEE